MPFYERYKEPLLYLFFGALCTLVNIVSFWLVTKIMPPLAANVIAWIVAQAAVIVGNYVISKKFVFSN